MDRSVATSAAAAAVAAATSNDATKRCTTKSAPAVHQGIYLIVGDDTHGVATTVFTPSFAVFIQRSLPCHFMFFFSLFFVVFRYSQTHHTSHTLFVCVCVCMRALAHTLSLFAHLLNQYPNAQLVRFLFVFVPLFPLTAR